MNKMEEARADLKELLDFIERIGKWSTAQIRVECNVLLAKHGRAGVPLHLPMLRAGPAHSQGRIV